MSLPTKTTKMRIVKTGTVVKLPVRKNVPGRPTSLKGRGMSASDPRMS